MDLTNDDSCRQAFVRRCPRLGGAVPFTYCLECEADKNPCFKIFDCWWETFDVVGYLKDTLAPEQFESLAQKQPKTKVASLVEIINKARANS